MKFSEIFTPKNFYSSIIANRLGVTSFPFGSERRQEKTPHELMKQALMAYESRPVVNSGVNQLVLLITGGQLNVVGETDSDVKLLQKWLDYRPHLQQEVQKLAMMYLVTGNVPVELGYKMKGEKFYIDDFRIFPDPSRFYRGLYTIRDETGEVVENDNEYWLVEVDRKIRSVIVDGKNISPQIYRVHYSPYAVVPQRIIYAIPFHKSKFIFLKSFYNKWFYYSYSFVMSILDDVDAMFNIIQNIINITKYKAIGKTIITIGDEKNPASPEDIEKINEMLETGNFDNIVINKPINVDHLSYEGDYNTLTNELDWLRREIGSGLTPNYLTPFNSEVNRATSQEVKLVLDAQLKIWRRSILHFLNTNIIPSLKEYFNIKSDVWFDFKEFDLYTPDEKLNIYDRLYNSNIVSLNEYRKAMGLDTLEGGDIFRTEYESRIQQKYNQTGFSMSYKPTEGNFSEGVSILKQRETKGHVITLKQNDNIFEVYDGAELKLQTEDKDTAETYYNNLVKKIIHHELEFPEYEYNEEEEELVKQLNDSLVKVKKEIDELLSKHTEGFKEVKVINLKVVNPLQKTISKLFDNVSNSFNLTLSKVFNKSKQQVADYLKKVRGDVGLNKINKIDMSKLKLDAYKQIFSKDLDQLKNKKVLDLSRQVADSYIMGVPSSKIKQQVMDAVNDIHHEAERIVRTNVNRMAIASKLLLFKQMDIDKFIWITTIDDRTRESHRRRHGVVYNVDRALRGLDPAPTMVRDSSGKWIPEENINCRCTIRPYYS